jgi:WD40 repeat protein
MKDANNSMQSMMLARSSSIYTPPIQSPVSSTNHHIVQRQNVPLKRSSSERFSHSSSVDNGKRYDSSGLMNDLNNTDNVIAATPYHVLQSSGQTAVSTLVKLDHILFSADGGVKGGRVCGYDLYSNTLINWSSSWGVLAMTGDANKQILIGSRTDGRIIIWKDIFRPGHLTVLHRIYLPRIGHVLSMSFFDTNLIVGSQDGNVRRISLGAILTDDDNNNKTKNDHDSNQSESHHEIDKDCLGYVIECPVDYCKLNYKEESCFMKPCTVVWEKLLNKQQRNPCHDAARSHCGLVTSVTSEYRGSIFSGSSCGLIKRWDLQTNECVEIYGGHSLAVTEILLDAEEGILYSCSRDGTVRIRNVQNIDASYHEGTLKTNSNKECLTCLAVLSTQTLCAGSASGVVYSWDLTFSDIPTRVIQISSLPINCLAVVGIGLLAGNFLI